MKKYLMLLALASCASKIPTTMEADQGSLVYVLNLKEQKQEKDQWCWAASFRFLLSKDQSTLPAQCEIVTKVKGLDCCDKKNALKCNQPSFADDAARAYGVDYTLDKTPSFSEVVAHIKAGKPVAITHANRGGTSDGTAHMVVAYGTYTVKGKPHIVAYDPLTGSLKHMDDSYVVGNLAWFNLLTLN